VCAAAVVFTAALGLPAAAWAHGVDDAAAGMSVAEFVLLGAKHMLLGWDHLLFILGVVLLAGDVRRAAKLISVFAVGHSTTLIAATLAGPRVDARLVDVAITLSLVFVGVVGWWVGRPRRWHWFGVAVFGFGLVHGLGLASRLQGLGLGGDGLLGRVVAFNLGVELGQLVAVVAMFLVNGIVAGTVTVPDAARFAFVGLALVGLMAASILTDNAVRAPAGDLSADAGCQVRERTETYRDTGARPAKRFFEPDEAAPLTDFGRALDEGYVIVHYRPTLPADQVARLREFFTGRDGVGVIGGATPGQAAALRADATYATITCGEFDLPALRYFTRYWLGDPAARPAG
jgi:hypothetical protein